MSKMESHQHRQPSTRDSWKTLPFPEQCEQLDFQFDIKPQFYEARRMGIIPQVMEDKWFQYMEDNWVYFHRSWTGYCVYKIKIAGDTDTGYRTVEAWANRDPEQYRGDTTHDIRWLKAFFGIRD